MKVARIKTNSPTATSSHKGESTSLYCSNLELRYNRRVSSMLGFAHQSAMPDCFLNGGENYVRISKKFFRKIGNYECRRIGKND